MTNELVNRICLSDYLPKYNKYYPLVWERFEKPAKTPTDHGVYIITHQGDNEEENIVYIGRSINLKNRLVSHPIVRLTREVFCDSNSYQTNIYYTCDMEDKNDYIELESKLIKKYKPRFNINLKS
jgi:excinuclease UvrABC nuclease subunit